MPPPLENNLLLVDQPAWEVPLGGKIAYRCSGTKQFETDEEHPSLNNITLVCDPTNGTYVVPPKWPNCTDTVRCGLPPAHPEASPPWNESGSISWLNGAPPNQDTYDTTVRYACPAGSKFDTDHDGLGDADIVETTCLWNKRWSPFSPGQLPLCVPTHCIRPFSIPADSYLEEAESAWTPVGEDKEYRCKGLTADGVHTRFFDSDRSRSSFSMHCRADGTYEFVDTRSNWHTCLEDIECAGPPPEIPTHSEYVVSSPNDGSVSVVAFNFPGNTSVSSVHTSDFDHALLPSNFNASLTYSCGRARHFVDADTGFTAMNKTMTCQWDSQWLPDNVLGRCEWYACLRPPTPPKGTRLRVTDWDGEPIQFGRKVRFVCELGTAFEHDPHLEGIEFECRDGSVNKSMRGFFDTPDGDWPRCVAGVDWSGVCCMHVVIAFCSK